MIRVHKLTPQPGQTVPYNLTADAVRVLTGLQPGIVVIPGMDPFSPNRRSLADFEVQRWGASFAHFHVIWPGGADSSVELWLELHDGYEPETEHGPRLVTTHETGTRLITLGMGLEYCGAAHENGGDMQVGETVGLPQRWFTGHIWADQSANWTIFLFAWDLEFQAMLRIRSFGPRSVGVLNERALDLVTTEVPATKWRWAVQNYNVDANFRWTIGTTGQR